MAEDTNKLSAEQRLIQIARGMTEYLHAALPVLADERHVFLPTVLDGCWSYYVGLKELFSEVDGAGKYLNQHLFGDPYEGVYWLMKSCLLLGQAHEQWVEVERWAGPYLHPPACPVPLIAVGRQLCEASEMIPMTWRKACGADGEMEPWRHALGLLDSLNGLPFNDSQLVHLGDERYKAQAWPLDAMGSRAFHEQRCTRDMAYNYGFRVERMLLPPGLRTARCILFLRVDELPSKEKDKEYFLTLLAEATQEGMLTQQYGYLMEAVSACCENQTLDTIIGEQRDLDAAFAKAMEDFKLWAADNARRMSAPKTVVSAQVLREIERIERRKLMGDIKFVREICGLHGRMLADSVEHNGILITSWEKLLGLLRGLRK